ncbi:MAG: DUF4148 domain-containing protein [Burkholderiales bacterium]|nr:DUF4148 domain-containing protein [Burkholderiales bacterium]
MNFKTLSALVITAAAAGSAFAESPGTWTNADLGVSTKTRAEVQAELAAYKKAGVNPWSISYSMTRDFRSTASRADVTAQYLKNRDAVAAINSEDGGAGSFAASQPAVASDTLAGQPTASGN